MNPTDDTCKGCPYCLMGACVCAGECDRTEQEKTDGE